jgi:acetylornithine deacetylase/succinyl-diaminopimelate desuccinylase family protein
MNNSELLKVLSESVSEDELVALTRKLVSIPSHWETGELETGVVKALEGLFSAEGIKYELQAVDDKRSNIIARLPGAGGGRSLAFNGHLDTVPPYKMTVNPFDAEIDGRKIFGRGTSDMKGPVAAMAMTLIAYRRSGISLKGDLIFTGVLAEETNSIGVETLVKSGFKADGAVVGEPSGREYAIGHRGLEWLEIEFKGKAVHSGIAEQGVNAIVSAARFIVRLNEQVVPRLKTISNEFTGPAVVNVGFITGGTQPSTVAESCLVQIDRRYTPEEKLADVIEEFEIILKKMRLEDPSFQAELRRVESSLMKSYDHVPLLTSPEDQLVKSLAASMEFVLGRTPGITRRRGWTDAAILNYYGKIPTAVYGPGDITRSHTPDEYITIDELAEGFKIYSLLAGDFCQLAE